MLEKKFRIFIELKNKQIYRLNKVPTITTTSKKMNSIDIQILQVAEDLKNVKNRCNGSFPLKRDGLIVLETPVHTSPPGIFTCYAYEVI